MSNIPTAPEGRYTPDTPDKLKTMATMGALLALFGAGDNLLRMGKLDKRLNQKVGMSALQRMYNDADKMNRHFEKMWQVQEADQMGFLHNDVATVLLVMTSVDLESRTNVANEFRRVWAQLLSGVGDETITADTINLISRIRQERGLEPLSVQEAIEGSDMFDNLTYNVGDEKKSAAVPRPEVDSAKAAVLDKAMEAVKEFYTQDDFDKMDIIETERVAQEEADRVSTEPNCLVMLRDKGDGTLLDGQVHVAWADKVNQEVFTHSQDGLYFRSYPTGIKLIFTAFADGYLPGGCEKLLYEGDSEQIVINIFLTPIA